MQYFYFIWFLRLACTCILFDSIEVNGQNELDVFPGHYEELASDSLLQKGFYATFNLNDDSARDIFKESLKIAFANKDSLKILNSFAGFSYFYLERGATDSAEYYVKQAFNHFNLNEPSRYRTFFFNQWAHIEAAKGFRKTAYMMLDSAASSALPLKDWELIARISLARGYFNLGEGSYKMATKSFQSADSIYSLFPSRFHVQRAKCWMGQGMILSDAGNYQRALQKYQDAEAEVIQSNHPESGSLEISIKRLMGQHYLDVDQLQLADSIFEVALNKASRLGKETIYIGIVNRYSEIKMRLGELDEAQAVLESVSESKIVEDLPFHKSRYHYQMGKLLLRQGKAQESIGHLRQSIKLIEKKTLSYTYYLKYLAQAYKEIGLLDSAYHYMKSYGQVKDSLNQQAVQSHLSEMESKMFAAEKESEISKIELARSRENLENQRAIGLIAIGAMLLLLVTLFLYFRIREKTLAHKKLSELNQLRSKLFSDISHEFRTPLSLIKGPLLQIKEKLSTNSDLRDEFDIVDRNTSSLDRMIDEIQSLALLDEKKLKLTVQQNHLEKQLRIIGASFESRGVNSGITFHSNLQIPNGEYYYNLKHLETILYNLLSNAFKFTDEGRVILSACVVEGILQVDVEDTGVGMSQEDVLNVFNRFFQVGNETYRQGSGIGLSLCKELSSLHYGAISVKSEVGQGTKFTLSLPVTYEFYDSKNIPIVISQDDQLIGHQSTFTGKEEKGTDFLQIDNDQIILVIEDHPDMVRHISSIFSSEFKIITAPNGEIGIQKATEKIPDIILSDLMMPIKNGNEVLAHVKKDHLTSHIPFIMLTANHEEEEKMRGLTLGANDFITKPFSPAEIRQKVKNLLLLRDQVRKKYSGIDDIPEVLLEANADRGFWLRLKEVVKENIDDPDFSTDDFAREMFMSRMQLHRKLKATTNLSTSLFLRRERVRKSIALLRNTQLSIASIAYEVGFSNPSFFSKCFKEVTGKVPSAYRP